MQTHVIGSMLAERPVTPASAMLHTLLDANVGLPPEYRGGLTNHLPMALQALHAMGASSRRMLDFYANYARRFEWRVGARGAAPVADWRVLRGQGEHYPEGFHALVATFERTLARDGESAVLRHVLPELLTGVAAVAFHGVIRTAHAVQAGHRAELAHALAYWAWRWQPLPQVPAPAPAAVATLSFDAWADRLVNESVGQNITAPLISLRMSLAAETPTYLALGAALQPVPDLLRQLAGLALQRYLASRNFTVLHMITGLRALRVLLPWIADVQALQPVLVRAFTAAYLAAQLKPQASRPMLKESSWPEVMAAAIANDDDHVIKLVHACHEEFAAYGDSSYLEAAILAVS
jgi:Questin oxidase-like